MELKLSKDLSKEEVFQKVKAYLEKYGFRVVTFDQSRPWGGFYVIEEQQAAKFTDFFFRDIDSSEKYSTGKISPKILIVERGKRLSWQYHFRRAELWKVIGGEVGVITSENDIEGETQIKKTGDIIKLHQGERHRLIGLENWGIVAEIWQHTNNEQLSDENDIVRIQDDFGR